MTSTTKGASRSDCPIATTLTFVGDRWTLVIVRDMLNGKKRFAEFLDSPERITTNVLTDRLNRMEQGGPVQKSAYLTNPIRFEYELTKKGIALHPMLQDMCRWANKYEPQTWTPPKSFMSRRVNGRKSR